MKNITSVLAGICLLLSSTAWSQSAVLEIVNSTKSLVSTDYPQIDHVISTYAKLMDDAAEPDTTLEVDGVTHGLILSNVEDASWEGNTLVTKTSQPADEDSDFTSSWEFDDKGRLVSVNREFVAEARAKFMNERQTIHYDEAGHVTKLANQKKDAPEPNVYFQAVYGDDGLPDTLKSSVMMDIAIVRSQVGDSIHYEFTQAVPQDLMDMLKAELGENPSPEAIKEALGPFGTMPTEYSKVLQKDGQWHEWHYKDQGAGVQLVAYVVADSDLNILERKTYSEGSEVSAEVTTYTPDGKVLSRTSGGEVYENTFDDAGNVLTEMTANFTKLEYVYDSQGRVLQKIEYMGDDLLSISLTKY